VTRPPVLAVVLILTVLALRPPSASAQARCPGDCEADGSVTVDDLLLGVNIALELQPLSRCTRFDSNDDGAVAVEDMIAATLVALNGCPATPTATSTASTTPTPSFTATSTPSATPSTTPTVNRPPVLPPATLYRTYPGHEIRFAIGATDPDGDALRYTADALPQGAILDELTGEFAWTPGDDQLGPFEIPFTCSDQGTPAETVEGSLVFKVQPPDLCTAPQCDPETGCSISLPPVTDNCCQGNPTVRVAEPAPSCPAGRVLFLGRNNAGFGRMQNCDTMRIINFLQAGAVARFHVESRCLRVDQPVIVRARMDTAVRGMVFDLGQQVVMARRDDGFSERLFVTFPIQRPPYFDLEGAEANLRVSIRDVDGAEAVESIRLKLTFTPLPDLPESDPTLTPTPIPTPPPF